MKSHCSFNLPSKLYEKVKDKVLLKNGWTMTELIIRCMVLSVEDKDFVDYLDKKYYDYSRIFDKEYKNE